MGQYCAICGEKLDLEHSNGNMNHYCELEDDGTTPKEDTPCVEGICTECWIDNTCPFCGETIEEAEPTPTMKIYRRTLQNEDGKK